MRLGGLSGIAFSVLLAGGPADACEAALASALSAYGIEFAQIQDLKWFTDRFVEDGRSGPVSGYRVYGRPAQCTEGTLVLALDPSCGISDLRTRGGCRIEGIRSSWF
jgi:hypothetical protein